MFMIGLFRPTGEFFFPSWPELFLQLGKKHRFPLPNASFSCFAPIGINCNCNCDARTCAREIL